MNHRRLLAAAMLGVGVLTNVLWAGDDKPEAGLLGEFATVEAFTGALAAAEQAGTGPEALFVGQLVQGLRFSEPMLLRGAVTRAEAGLELDREQTALLAIAKGVIASEDGRYAEAEAQFKEAFWIAPSYAKTIENFAGHARIMPRMQRLTVDLDRSYADTAGKRVTLRELMQGKKSMLIDFWASWCGPCMRAMPELKRREQELRAAGIAVVGLNTEKDAQQARTVQQEMQIEFSWLLDDELQPLDDFLEVDSIPRAVVVTPEGKVLYNGHPADARLERLLAALRKDA